MIKKIKIYSHWGLNGETALRYYKRGSLGLSVSYESISVQLPNMTDRIPSYLDQWIDTADNNNWKGVWSSVQSGNLPQYADATDDAHNLYKADTFVVSAHEPVIVSNSPTGSNGRIQVRGKGGATDSYDYTVSTNGWIRCAAANDEYCTSPAENFFGDDIKDLYMRCVYKTTSYDAILMAQGDASNYIRLTKESGGIRLVIKNNEGVQDNLFSVATEISINEEVEVIGGDDKVTIKYNGIEVATKDYIGFIDDFSVGDLLFNTIDEVTMGGDISFYYMQAGESAWNFCIPLGAFTESSNGKYLELVSSVDPLAMWGSSGTTVTNTTGIFNSLPVGYHIISIEDQETGPHEPGSQPLLLYPAFIYLKDSFLPKYQAQFTNDLGNEIYVQILKKGHVGSPEEICLSTNNPVTLTTDIIGDDFLSGIMPMDIEVLALKQNDSQFSDIIGADNGDWRIRILDGVNLDITGNLVIENINFDHQDAPTTVSLSAVAGLSDIDDVTIEGWSGPITLIEVINYVMQEYNQVQYGLKEFVGIQAETDPDGWNKQFLRKYLVNAAMFNGMSAKEAINTILNNFGCTLTHSYDNNILIQAIDGLTLVGSTLDGSAYLESGEWQMFTTQTVEYVTVKSFGDITAPEDIYYLNAEQNWGVLPRVNRFKVKDEFTEVDTWEMETELDRYVYIHGEEAGALTIGTEEGTIAINDVDVGDSKQFYNTGKASAGSFRVYHKGMTIKFSHDYQVGIFPDIGFDLNDQYMIQTLWMYGENYSVNYHDECLDPSYGALQGVRPSTTGEWETREHTNVMVGPEEQEVAVPTGGVNIRLWFYGLWSYTHDLPVTYAQFKNAKLEVLLPETYEKDLKTVDIYNGNEGITIEDITLSISDAPRFDGGYGLNIGGVIVASNLSLVQEGWTSFASGAGSLKQITANRINLLRSENVKRLNGTLHMIYPKAGQVIYDPTLSGSFLMLQKYSYDVKNNELSCSALELTKTTAEIAGGLQYELQMELQ